MSLRTTIVALGCALAPVGVAAQQAAPPASVARVEIAPAALGLDVNDTARVSATAYDSSGRRVDAPIVFFSTSRRSVGVDSTGLVTAHRPGEFRIIAIVLGGGPAARAAANVAVRWPPVRTVEITGAP
ncbi:MAG: hypothetical protein ACREMJ_01125, partial [Gemmatimonadales bacterium]